jgi:hypothetical protein
VVEPPPTNNDLYDAVCWCDRDKTTISWNGTLPTENVLALMIKCPLVFSQSRWAVRKLTYKELAAAFDISEAHIPREFQKPAPQRLCRGKQGHKTLPFLQAAPMHLLSEMLGMLVPRQVKPINEARSMGAPFSSMVSWPTHELPEWSGSTEVATRADDAQVPVHLWNERALRLQHNHDSLVAHMTRYGQSALESLRGSYCGYGVVRFFKAFCTSRAHMGGASTPTRRQIGIELWVKSVSPKWQGLIGGNG